MAENEKLDLGYPRSGRWRKWRDSIRGGKSCKEVAEEGVRCLAQTSKNLQKGLEEQNGIPLKQVLMAVTGEDGSFDEIMRHAHFGRDYLQLFELQCGQGLDEHAIIENVMTLTVERWMDQIGQQLIGAERFPNAWSFREFALSVKDEMCSGIKAIAKQLAESPDRPVRMPSRTSAQKEQHHAELLYMSIGVREGSQP